MSSITYSNLILKKRESRINGGSHLQYNGLRVIETVKLTANSTSCKPKGIIWYSWFYFFYGILVDRRDRFKIWSYEFGNECDVCVLNDTF